MNYSVNNLTTVAECNVLLSMAAKEKADLNYKKMSDEYMATRFTENSVELSVELQAVMAELAGVETSLASIPEGAYRNETLDRQTRLTYKKFTIETRIKSSGTIALLKNELELGRLDLEITEVDAFTAAVTERMAGLPQT